MLYSTLFTSTHPTRHQDTLLRINKFLADRIYDDYPELLALLNNIKANGRIEVNRIFKVQCFSAKTTLGYSTIALGLGIQICASLFSDLNDLEPEQEKFAFRLITMSLAFSIPGLYLAKAPFTTPKHIFKAAILPVVKELDLVINLDDLFNYLSNENNGSVLQHVLTSSSFVNQDSSRYEY